MPKRKKSPANPRPSAQKPRVAAVIAVLIFAGLSLAVFWFIQRGQRGESYVPRPKGTVTYNKHVAPILHQHCLNCHRPGESAHLDLVTYADAKKYAKLISKVVESGYMPPWLPARGCSDFADERRLSVDQIGLVRQWVAEGAIEGNPADLPPLPKWTEGWQLGKPDLVITMPEPYRLEPNGKDIYRNFVIPIPVTETRFVQAVEFRPGNPKVVHHAAMRIDPTSLSQKIDAQEAGPGFSGMTMPESTIVPNGQFLNWQPGKLPYRSPEGLCWVLQRNTDMVVQLHLRPGEKAEMVQCSIGLFFTDTPPTKEAFKIILDAPTLDISAGAENHVVTDSLTLPVDVDLFAMFPHCHYLGKDLQGFASLPDGTKKCLLHIKQWDFDWQGDYRFKTPIFLPKGTTLTMQFTYDNSTNNLRNPNHPPKRVLFGPQTTDEMGELWFQAVPRSREDFNLLTQVYNGKELRKMLTTSEYKLALDPSDARAHLQLGKVLIGLQRLSDALPHFDAAARLEPTNDLPHYFLGVTYRLQRDVPRARRELESALELNSENYKTHGNLGQIYLEEGDFSRAEYHFQTALRLNPEDVLARQGLKQIARPK